MSLWSLFFLLFIIKSSDGLTTINAADAFEIGVAGCHNDDSCTTYDVCQDDDCIINCNDASGEVCQNIKVNIINNGQHDVTINCHPRTCTQTIIETDDSFQSITLNGGLHVGGLITYGTGDVTANQVSQATFLFLHGQHENVIVNFNHASLYLSAINTKNLLINGDCSGDCRPTIYTPIAPDSTTTIDVFQTRWHLNGFHIYSLRGTTNLVTSCDGIQGDPCHPDQIQGTHKISNVYLYFGKDYTGFCFLSHGGCDGIDTSLGNQLDDYSIIYADKYLQSTDFRARTDNLLVYYFQNENNALYGPTNADISVFCVSSFYHQSCGHITIDFSASSNAVLANWVWDSTIIGPSGSFTEQGYYQSRAGRNTYNLENTLSIDFIPVCTSTECTNADWQVALDSIGWQLQDSTLNIGNNKDLSLQCRNQYEWSCSNLVIHSDLDPDCVELENGEWEFIFTAYTTTAISIDVQFDVAGVSCSVTKNSPNCGGTLKMENELPADAECQEEDVNNNGISDITECQEGIWSDWSCDAVCKGSGTERRTRSMADGTPCTGIDDIEEQECTDRGPATFDWDTLVSSGTDIPEVDVRDFSVNNNDLSLNIEVALRYLGKVSADDEDVAKFGVSYILDFEDVDAHKTDIYKPGTCENRKESDFAACSADTGNFDDCWTYSEDGTVGTAETLAYPPQNSDKWDISIKDNGCDTVIYNGHFTWNELRGCTDNTGNIEYTSVAVDDNWLNLTGTFYINVISPFWYGTEDLKYYRVYQLLSQPFVIAVSSTVYVLGSTGINLMTMSIIAVYKEDQQSDFKLVAMTETADYMVLERTAEIELPFHFEAAESNTNNVADITWDPPETAETVAGCLQNKNYLCTQLWEIEARDVICSKGIVGGDIGTDFTGTYTLGFNINCGGNQHCDDWLIDHPSITNPIQLSADLKWEDTICKPEVFTVQLSASMSFYHDNKGTITAPYDGTAVNTESFLYQVGEDRVYVEILTKFPNPDSETLSIFNTEIVNVWICTFPPDFPVPEPTKPDGTLEPLATMGCMNSGRDTIYDGKFYHIFEEGKTMELNHGFKEELIASDSNIERFSFIVPFEVARDTLYVHAQIEVELQELTTRRRMLLNVNTANRMQHFGDQIGINHGERHEYPPQNEPNHYYYHPNDISPPINNPSQPSTFILSLSSPWIIIIASLLGVILIFNIAFMFYVNCWKKHHVSFRNKKKGKYSAVKPIDSEEFDESEANPINI